MTIGYLLSVLDLYLLKEKNNTLLIQVDNKENLVKFNFTYSFDSINQTFVKIDKDLFFNNLDEIVKKIIGNLELVKENLETKNNKNIYTLNYSSKRIVTFVGFNKDEMVKIRDKFNLKESFSFDILKDTYDNKLLVNSNLKLQLGFSSYMSLFLSSIFLLDVLMISLWVFKAFLA